MLNCFQKLYMYKVYLQVLKGLQQGKIVPFDEEFYKSMSTTYFNCLPVSMHIKYLRPSSPPGKCYDRSLYMFFCFDDALLVRADNKDLEVRFGKENAGHGWIEIGNYVYDPSLLLRFDRELYYKIYKPSNISKTSVTEYKKSDDGYYDQVRNTKIEDFKIGGRKRCDLAVTIPAVQGIASFSKNGFKEELDDYLEKIEYDEKQVYSELVESCEEILRHDVQKKIGSLV